MVSENEIERVRSILTCADVIYGLEGLNPLMEDMLDQISMDLEWLVHRLDVAWATVASYQEELRLIYGD
jgi:hypothetical protein